MVSLELPERMEPPRSLPPPDFGITPPELPPTMPPALQFALAPQNPPPCISTAFIEQKLMGGKKGLQKANEQYELDLKMEKGEFLVEMFGDGVKGRIFF